MTTHTDRRQDTGAEVMGSLKPDAGAASGNRQLQAEGYAEAQTSAAHQNAILSAECIEIGGDPANSIAMDGAHVSDAPLAGACGYDAFEADFRGHHYTNAARRRGPYEHYRLVYRYGYDLGVDPRYRAAEWATVAQAARPRWEERNPGSWAQFQEMIRYAWDTVRTRANAQKGKPDAGYR
jgi:uncharacterized protein YjbJ (UPF0337 family)